MSAAPVPPRPQLIELSIGGPIQPWLDLGFSLEPDLAGTDTTLRVGSTRLDFSRPDAPGRIHSWATDRPIGQVDGLVHHEATIPSLDEVQHANGAVQLDHVVVMTPDLDRTDAALAEAGFDLRRQRDVSTPDVVRWQSFYRMGEVILEVVGPRDVASPSDRPASFWGLVVITADLDAAIESAAGMIGTARTAVQPGRRIATVSRDAGIGVAVAFMDREP